MPATPEHELAVSCEERGGGGWRCSVVVGADLGASRHAVAVDRETLHDLAPGMTPEELVRESFVFLLERETRESILRSFELPIIGRFFAGYADEISRRLRGD